MTQEDDKGSAAMLGSLDAIKGIDAGPDAARRHFLGKAKHDGAPEPTAQLPTTDHAVGRSRESDAGTGDKTASERVASLLDEIGTLGEEIDRLRFTEAERLAIDWAAVCAAKESQVAVHKTLRKLLARHK